MTNHSELDSVLSVVENPVRRMIIKRLSHEPSYPLELSKELGMGQQLIAAHLGVMEREGFLGSLLGTSPVGPSRKMYFLRKSVYLSIGFGPHLYNEQIFSFDALPNTISNEAKMFMSKIGKIQKSNEPASKMVSFSELLADVDAKLNSVEAEKAVLLYIRNLAMKQTNEIMEKTEKTHDQRRVLHYILDERSIKVEDIAAALNLRESVVRMVLQSLNSEVNEFCIKKTENNSEDAAADKK